MFAQTSRRVVKTRFAYPTSQVSAGKENKGVSEAFESGGLLYDLKRRVSIPLHIAFIHHHRFLSSRIIRLTVGNQHDWLKNKGPFSAITGQIFARENISIVAKVTIDRR